MAGSGGCGRVPEGLGPNLGAPAARDGVPGALGAGRGRRGGAARDPVAQCRWGMQCSSYSAMTISSAGIEHAGQCGSRLIL